MSYRRIVALRVRFAAVYGRPRPSEETKHMADRMLQFVRLPQQTPEKRAVPERREDFSEIYRRFDPAAASAQASRCSQCGIPFCSIHCPLSNNIPDWLKLTAEGRLEEAYEVSSATNNFPEICGRICPQDRLCEGNCVIEKGFESVTIGAVERHITDTALANGWVKPLRNPWASSAPAQAVWLRPRCSAAVATRCMSTTATTGSAG
jgi:hypothetical protein